MGLDLNLLIVDLELPHYPASHTVLSLQKTGIARVISDELEKTMEFTKDGLSCYFATITDGDNEGEHCYGQAKEDPYGAPIEWVYAKDLKPFKTRPEVKNSPFNKAAWAYIMALPDDTRIALYFH